MSLDHLTDHLADHLADLERRGLRRQLRTVLGQSGREVELDSRDGRGARRVLNFSANDYLGLASDPQLTHAAIDALHESGVGATASRLIIGNHSWHERLERALADFHEQPAALLFNSGYNANVGTLSALAGAGDVIFSDERNHASIIDGCRLSRARVRVFPHADLDALDAMLRMREPGERHRLVVTDSVFSMDGDRAPLARLRQLTRDHGASLIVDEAHATGVLGPRGQGLCAHDNVIPDVHVGTLSKAFGSFGAYVTGARPVTEVLLNRARSFVFTTALPPSVAAASLAALALVAGDDGERRRARLQRRIDRFATGLRDLGLLASGAGSTAIFPIVIGDSRRAMACSQALLARGIYAQGIRTPTVPPGTARLRFALMASHREGDIDSALHGLRDLMRDGLLPRAVAKSA